MEACPDCGAPIAVDAGFTAWCDGCGWNLITPRPAAAPSRKQRRRAERAARHEDAVLARAMRERGRPVRHDLRSRVAVSLAVMVHLVTLAVAGVGVWLCWQARHVPVLVAPALLCFVMAYALRPRLGRLRGDYVLTRESHPLFFGLLDSVSGTMGAPGFDAAVLVRPPTAATGRVGLRRRRVLFIGAALWSALDWDERVAVLAHEAGHNVSNDSRRGYLLGSSLRALEVWITTLTPSKARIYHFWQLLFRVVVRAPPRWVASRVYLAQMRLSTGVSRMAEYRADALSAAAAGTEPAVRALDKMLITDDFMKNITQTILWRPGVSMWAQQKEFVDGYPAKQRARLRRIDQMSAVSVYATHPTFSRRIAYLAADPVPGSAAPIPAERLAQIDAELEPKLRVMAETMRREVMSRLTPAQLETLGQY